MLSRAQRSTKRPRRSPGHAAEQQLVDDQQQRAHQHPCRHGAVDPPTRGGNQQAHARWPCPAAGLPKASMHRQQQPWERGIGQQRHGRAIDIRDDERVEDHHRAGKERRHPARTTPQRVEQAHRSPSDERQQRSEPQPLDDPVGHSKHMPEGEERTHWKQVARLLPGLHVAELPGRGPHRRNVAQEPHGIHVQVDLCVGGGQPGPLQ